MNADPTSDYRGEEAILLVDDEHSVLKVNRFLLSAFGYQVREADSGEKAVDILEGDHIDVVILDMVMPGMDGVATLRRIREMKPEQKVIIFSAYAEPEKVQEVKNLGIYAYLIKPAPRDKLLGTIRDALDDRPPPPLNVRV